MSTESPVMLTGEVVTLRRAEMADAERLAEILAQPEVAAWWGTHDLDQVRSLLGHKLIYTTQFYATIRTAQLKRAWAFYEEKAASLLS